MRTYVPAYIPAEPYKRLLSYMRSYAEDIAALKGQCSAVRRTELRRRTKAITDTLDEFDEDVKTVLRQNLVDGLPIEQCFTECSESTVRRWRKEFLTSLGKKLGEI